jgi:hypothetical protein
LTLIALVLTGLPCFVARRLIRSMSWWRAVLCAVIPAAAVLVSVRLAGVTALGPAGFFAFVLPAGGWLLGSSCACLHRLLGPFGSAPRQEVAVRARRDCLLRLR